MKEKKCPKCGKTLPITDFYYNRTKKDGHSDYCKDCMKEMMKPINDKRKAERAAKRAEKTTVDVQEEVKVSTVPKTDRIKYYSSSELVKELEDRGKKVFVDPTPRDLMLELFNLGYNGELEYYEKHIIKLNSLHQ